MDITEEKKDQSVVFSLKGRLDSISSSAVETKIVDSIEKGAHHVVLDFGSLDYLSSAGIRTLVQCRKAIEKKGGQVVLAAVPKPIENVLYITGFLRYFTIYDNTNSAVGDFNKGKAR